MLCENFGPNWSPALKVGVLNNHFPQALNPKPAVQLLVPKSHVWHLDREETPKAETLILRRLKLENPRFRAKGLPRL